MRNRAQASSVELPIAIMAKLCALAGVKTEGKAMPDRHREQVRAWLKKVLEESGLEGATLARRAGLAPSTVNRFLNDPKASHSLSARTLYKISQAVGIPLPQTLGGGTIETRVATEGGSRSTFAGPRNLPVLGHARAGAEGLFMDNGTVQAYVERPWFLEGNQQSYAVYVVDDSMEPAFRHGHMVYVDPTRPPGIGDDVVVELENGEAFIKEYRGWSDTHLNVAQHNPAKPMKFKRELVKSVHVIVGSLRVRT